MRGGDVEGGRGGDGVTTVVLDTVSQFEPV